jgi:hypothetical protein
LRPKHGKEAAIGPALAASPGLRVVVAAEVDTDRLGTFTGEVERPGPPRETALMKARLGQRATGLPRALASEGAFGAHPHTFPTAAGLELLAFAMPSWASRSSSTT